ncbi:GNAT family N-acetyltransferase [Salinimicrobium sp. TH3]|uniref:GNAT family N-acetyltransferase n=1 Tax=Salinimicrobium sp. TH3 TaxID=2997342 RepID=UPI0022757FEE|nr:GNAT family N-acetyltransferase [Salinimicrobium sp. TH3]MCY2686964.1 GNAT family N-acetyltransferase [Salinimicrobium sp. TH3]
MDQVIIKRKKIDKIEFREINYEQDLDDVIGLIQTNLRSDYSADLFNWKHLQNPFGRSYGLLALDGKKIIGVRMFMFWEFRFPQNKEIIRAIRPVDTVTDLEYRGKGLFKKLTLQGLHNCRKKYDIVFNTPNKNSLPGYLKMGWEKILDVDSFKVGLLNPFRKISPGVIIKIDDLVLKESAEFSNDSVTTCRTSDFYKWRYQDSEGYQIVFFEKEDTYVVFGKRKWFTIIYEIIGATFLNISMLNTIGIKTKRPFVYYYNSHSFEQVNFLATIKKDRPVIVLKNCDLKYNEQISFSLADLEAKF